MLGTGALPGQQMAQTRRSRTHQSCMLGLVGSSVQADRGGAEGPGARRDKTDPKGLLCMGDSRGNHSSGAGAVPAHPRDGWSGWLLTDPQPGGEGALGEPQSSQKIQFILMPWKCLCQ